MRDLFASRRRVFFSLALLLFLLALCACVLYAHDDLEWGTQPGLDRLASGFQGYNGRYLGNLIVMALTRSPLLRTAFMAACLFLTVTLSALFAGSARSLPLMTALFLMLPVTIARQTLGWVSGFANYGTAAALVAALLYAARGLFEDSPVPQRRAFALPMLLLGLCGALLMENVTVFFVLMPFGLYLYGRRRGAASTPLLFCALGALLGAALMFSNPVYRSIAAGSDGYRSVTLFASPLRTLLACFDTFSREMTSPLLMDALALLLVLSGLCFALLLSGAQRGPIARLCAGGVALYPLYPLMRRLHPKWYPFGSYTPYLEGTLALLYLACLLGVLLTCLPAGTARRRSLALYLSAALLTAPLCAVSPLGGRCFLPVYVLLCALTAQLACAVLSEDMRRRLLPLCLAAAAGLCSLWLSIFVKNALSQAERLAYLRAQAQAGAQEAYLPELPYPGYTWIATPTLEEGQRTFLSFYALPEDMRLSYVSYEDWYQIKKGL